MNKFRLFAEFMKSFRFFLLVLMLGLSKGMAAQNLQLTKGLDEKYLRAKFNMYKPDPWGGTYFEANAKYDDQQLSNTFFLLTRYLNFWEQSGFRNLDLMVGYSGGSTDAKGVYVPIKSSFTMGAAYKLFSGDRSRMLILQFAYREIAKGDTEVPFHIFS
jgi:hypothetical protein